VELEAALTQAQAQVEGYDGDRRTERDRADELKAELERERAYSQSAEKAREEIATELARARQDRDERERARATLESELERYQRNHACTEQCSENSHVAFTGKGLIKELRTELEAANARALSNHEWAERAEARVAAYALDLGAVRRELDEAREKLVQAKAAVNSPEILTALQTGWTNWSQGNAAALTTAVRSAQLVLATVRSEAPSDPTSQA
jgi:chromosome segregation ATPase